MYVCVYYAICYIYIYILCMCIHICIYIYACVYTHICYIYTYIHICIRMCIHIYIYTCIYIYIYREIEREREREMYIHISSAPRDCVAPQALTGFVVDNLGQDSENMYIYIHVYIYIYIYICICIERERERCTRLVWYLACLHVCNIYIYIMSTWVPVRTCYRFCDISILSAYKLISISKYRLGYDLETTWARTRKGLRPISLLRFWISRGLTQAQS